MNTYSDDDLLQLSGLQHFAFCRRQWALIHIEKQWQDNWRTADGQYVHRCAHNPELREKRDGILIVRGLSIASYRLGLSGQCDIVEFHPAQNGIPMSGQEGLWIPYPIEYKRGAPKIEDFDELQLCAQAMCLEDMLCCHIQSGALFYNENKRRTSVEFSDNLREKVLHLSKEMHELYAKAHTPKARVSKQCRSCSLNELCLPKILHNRSVHSYIINVLGKSR